MSATNQCVVLSKRPGTTNPATPECFRAEPCQMPVIGENELLIKTTMLSVDPAQRCCLNDNTGVEYVKAYEVGAVINGFGGVGTIEKVGSNLTGKYSIGDIVSGSTFWPWQKYWLASPEQITKVQIPMGHDESIILSCLGLIGLTVLLGFKEKGHVEPGKQQTVVISGAAGACGVLAGQIARLLGATRIVGICGSDEKCEFLMEKIGFDAAINYKTSKTELSERLKAACPNGVQCYFDNVGGDISETVVCQVNAAQMTKDSHVILCGQISQYNSDVPYPPPISDEMTACIKERNITRERFLVLNYPDKFPTAQHQLFEWLSTGKLKVHCTVTEGLENAGSAFCGMMNGKNIGKQIVKV